MTKQARDRIRQVEAHAEALNLTIADLCAQAGVAYSTWWRWNTMGTSPQLDTVNKLLAVTAK